MKALILVISLIVSGCEYGGEVEQVHNYEAECVEAVVQKETIYKILEILDEEAIEDEDYVIDRIRFIEYIEEEFYLDV